LKYERNGHRPTFIPFGNFFGSGCKFPSASRVVADQQSSWIEIERYGRAWKNEIKSGVVVGVILKAVDAGKREGVATPERDMDWTVAQWDGRLERGKPNPRG
jgi:hypothetical protein